MKHRLLLILLLAITVSSCESTSTEEPEIKRAMIILDPKQECTFNIGELGETVTIPITATGQWRAAVKYSYSPNGNWITVDPSSGESGKAQINITVSTNKGEMRSATITLKTADMSISLTINQAAATTTPEETIILDPEQECTFNIGEAGEIISVPFTATGQWCATVEYSKSSDNGWITINPSSGESGKAQIDITVATNKGAQRSATITLKTADISISLTINQAATAATPDDPDDPDKIYVNFEDENLKNYCVEHYDKDGDGKINLNEAALVTTITSSAEIGFNSLKGIESFPNLIELAFEGNSELNQVDFSQNKDLRKLHLPKTKLTALNLKENIALTDFSLGGGMINQLDLSQNWSLQTLAIKDSPGLTEVVLNSELQHIDIQNCAALSYINFPEQTKLTDIVCCYVPLATLDVSMVNGLNRLVCHHTQLTVLDISQNKHLTHLQVTPMNAGIELAYLIVSDMEQISSIPTIYVAAATKILVKGSYELSEYSYDVAAEGAICEEIIITTDTYTIIGLPHWIDCDEPQQIDCFTKKWSFNVLANEVELSRSAEVWINDSTHSVVAKILFNQQAKLPKESDAEGGNQDIEKGDDIIL